MATTDTLLKTHTLAFTTNAEQLAFSKELQTLLADKQLAKLVRNNTISPLYDLYLLLSGEQSAFEIAWSGNTNTTEATYSILQEYFYDYLALGLTLPNQAIAIEVFIHLCGKNIDSYYAEILLKTEVLSSYRPDTLLKLKQFSFEKLYVFIDCLFSYRFSMDMQEKVLLLELLSEIEVSELDDYSPLHLKTFIKEVFPIFVDRFAHRMTAAALYSRIDKIVPWYSVWRQHYLQLEELLDKSDAYYSLPFATIIQYIPEFIWWNNGVNYQGRNKKLGFSSLGFFHLAKGGSIRKAPDNYPFTRGMARVFATLPYNFDQTGKNMYIYCFGHSLGAGALLADLFQQFFRHYQSAIPVKEEMARWNPIIQKMAIEEFEALERIQAIQVMGYLYHALRDQPNFTVKRSSFASIIRAADAYHARIQDRIQRGETARLIRAELYRQRMIELGLPLEGSRNKLLLQTSWKAHPSIKYYTYKNFSIQELTTRKMLNREGAVMGHCVGSYAAKCLKGQCSIWSLQEYTGSKSKSRVTIEVNPEKRIIQASAKCNARPKEEYLHIIKRWADKNGIKQYFL